MEDFELRIDGQDISNTRIYTAIQDRDAHKVLDAIYQGENVNLRDQEFQSTYLHLVVSIADPVTEPKLVPMVYQLANAGVDVNACDYKGRTALDLAIHRQLQDLMVALIRVGIDPKEKDYHVIIQDMVSPFELELIGVLEKFEPGMWHTVATDNVSMAQLLINSWCRINIHKKGISLLQYARGTNKSQEMIELLDYYEVTIEFVHATLAGDEKRMLDLLMDSKPCDPFIMDISYQERWSKPLTPLSLRDAAIGLGHTHVLHLLPEEESSETKDGNSQEVNTLPSSSSVTANHITTTTTTTSDTVSLNPVPLHHKYQKDEQKSPYLHATHENPKGALKITVKTASALSTPKQPKSKKASTWSKARSRLWKGSVSKRSSLDDSALGPSLNFHSDTPMSQIASPRRSSNKSNYLYDLQESNQSQDKDEIGLANRKSPHRLDDKDPKSKLCVIS